MPASGKADIWALGCILLEMYMGRTWPSAAAAAKLFTVGPYSGHLPPALADIIQQCLAINPEARPTASQVKQVRSKPTMSALIEPQALTNSTSICIPQLSFFPADCATTRAYCSVGPGKPCSSVSRLTSWLPAGHQPECCKAYHFNLHSIHFCQCL